MRKMINVLLVMFVVLLIASSAFAQGSFRDIFIKSPQEVKTEALTESEAPALRTILGATSPLPINLTGDTIYLCKSGTWGVGAGMDLASWKGVVTLRPEISASDTDASFVGAGVFLNIPKLFSMISGVTWNASYINPSLGIVPGYDFGKNQPDVGIVLSIVQVTF